MKAEIFILALGLTLLTSACEKYENGLLLFEFSRNQGEEDRTIAFRSAFSGDYSLQSIIDIEGMAWDLNNDEKTSKNIAEEFPKGMIERLKSSFGFLEGWSGKDGGLYYEGLFSLVIPIQYNDVDGKSHKNAAYEDCTIPIRMKLLKDGSAHWDPFLQNEAEEEVIPLRNGSVIYATDGLVIIEIMEVPVYDCLDKEWKSRSLRYYLLHD